MSTSTAPPSAPATSGWALDRVRRAVFHRTGDSLGKLIGIAVLLTAMALLVVAFVVANVRGLSTLDEYTHLDWVYQITQGNLPADGDLAAPKVLSDWACLGQWNAQLPPCGQPIDPSLFPAGGQQYNASHTPLYYMITAGLVQVGQFFVGDQHFVTLAQLTGALWLSAAMVMLYVACRVWRIRTIYAIAAPLVLLCLPPVVTASTIVTDDAPAVLAGAYAVYYLGRFRISRVTYLLVPAILAVLFTATKVLNALPMLVIAAGLSVFAVIAFLRRQPRTGWLRLRASIALGAPSVVVYLVWTRFQDSRALPGWVNPVVGVNTYTMSNDPLTSWISSLVRGFNLLAEINVAPEMNSRYYVAFNSAISIPVAAAALMTFILYRRHSRRRWPGILLFAGCLMFPLIVQLQALRLGDVPQYFPAVSARYGISLIPLAVCCLAMIADTRRLRRTTIAVVAFGLVALGAAVFGYLPR